MLAIPLVAGLLNAGSITLLRQETIEIPVAQYISVRFVLPPHLSDSASLQGIVSINPDTASIELILLHIDDYIRWRSSSGTVDTLKYISISSGPFEIEVPGLGSYALVVSNRGNYRPASLVLDLDVFFAGSGKTGDPLPVALRLALFLMMAGTAAIAVGSVLSRKFYGRKHKT
ncbi:MAG: hypothetical protein KAR44_11895 [Candidatus Aegiribacteria sp.]|nr:hypothetical protein [Candidatus Aegiribacteria sp.]